MPTYQYRCTECGSELEVVQKFTDDPLTVCPECEGSLRKVFNAVGVVFKGSGFYATDNRTKGKAAAAKAEPSTSGASAPAAGSSASTPAASSSSTGKESAA
ncbi:MAG: zinc ribbon domain-containing protein [Propionibacteriales bacterium]|nr:zinc ribbon domain-containing protein [Propionibacteriales bacterium]